MAGSRVMESLDSLWFFTNVLSPREQSLGSAATDDEITTDNHAKEEPPEPNTPILQNQLKELSSAAEIEAQEVKPAEMGSPELQRSTERRRTRRRSKRSLNQRRKNVPGEVDLSVKDVCGCWMFVETCRHQSIMPSFNDNAAMKEHLKSWAYAVAVAVSRQINQFQINISFSDLRKDLGCSF